MRIISKFHDFYDSLMNGSDSNVWIREQATIFIDKNDLFFKRYEFNNSCPVGTEEANVGKFLHPGEGIPVETMILIFCGQIIPRWRCKDATGYFLDELKHFLSEQGVKTEAPTYWCFSPFRRANKLFAGEVPPEFATFNLKYKCPIILLRQYQGNNRDLRYVMELNPCLKDLEFMRIMNTVETFQELERFIFNDLVETDNVTSTGNDKVIAACKGFGHKYAFRKEPENQK